MISLVLFLVSTSTGCNRGGEGGKELIDGRVRITDITNGIKLVRMTQKN